MESTLPKEEEMNADAPSTHCSKPHLGLNFSGDGVWMGNYALTRSEPSNWHLTTTIVTSSRKPTSPQKFAALLKI
jgi:hypothetical protein